MSALFLAFNACLSVDVLYDCRQCVQCRLFPLAELTHFYSILESSTDDFNFSIRSKDIFLKVSPFQWRSARIKSIAGIDCSIMALLLRFRCLWWMWEFGTWNCSQTFRTNIFVKYIQYIELWLWVKTLGNLSSQWLIHSLLLSNFDIGVNLY